MKVLKTLLVVSLATAVSVPAVLAGTEKLSLDTFSKVKVNAPVDLKVTAGEKQSVTMSGKDEYLEKLIVKVVDDTLVIKKKRHSGKIKNVKFTINVKDLEKFVINGSSDAIIRKINSDKFTVAINGSGDVDFSGKSDKLNISINGSGDVASAGFDSKSAHASISGSGDIALHGKCEDLSVSISGSGDFSGKEFTCDNVKTSISGSGDATVYASKAIRVSSSGSSDINVYGHPKSLTSSNNGSSHLQIHDNE